VNSKEIDREKGSIISCVAFSDRLMELLIALLGVLAGRSAHLLFTKSSDLYMIKERENISKSNQKVLGR